MKYILHENDVTLRGQVTKVQGHDFNYKYGRKGTLLRVLVFKKTVTKKKNKYIITLSLKNILFSSK